MYGRTTLDTGFPFRYVEFDMLGALVMFFFMLNRLLLRSGVCKFLFFIFFAGIVYIGGFFKIGGHSSIFISYWYNRIVSVRNNGGILQLYADGLTLYLK